MRTGDVVAITIGYKWTICHFSGPTHTP